MVDILHTPTIMLSSFATLVIFAAFFGLAWRQERKSLELLLWSSAFAIGALGFVLLTLRGDGYNFITISLGNALAVLGLAMIWLGLRAFDNQPLKIASALIGPLLWIVVTYSSDYVRESVTSRIVLYSMLIFAYSALIAHEIFRSENFRKLPSSYIVAFVFATHGLLYLARIPLILIWPLAGNTAAGTAQPLWYQLLTFELFLHSLAGGFAFFAMVKERTQQRYKLASETDALTGVPNRRSFLAQLESHLATQPARGALLYLDIDHFKAINDRFGHTVGDQVLVEFAGILSKAVPRSAVIARIGGEEFAACLPQADRADAIAIADSIRTSLEARRMSTAKGVRSATVSIGIAFADRHEDVHAIISAADAALYAAKAAGRNSVWSDDPSGVPQFAAGSIAPAETAATLLSLSPARSSAATRRPTGS
ncbi:GGDEF domain-containing protein [Ensifer sp. ENS09]|uniref:GGDEF domain-containing protein n=1 Tax=Ensifer sp. ENS09 TaxID=2769263 RepID=UPI0017832A6D|nr:GGDEF domain-containing protein [Ensifer sp. ENS09]MBD9652812.1 GGDEF domain-containing protein [Ensifer sp. ENS09]